MKDSSARQGARVWICVIWSALIAVECSLAGSEGGMAAGAPFDPPLHPGQMNVGLSFDDRQAERFGDFLIPMYSCQSGLLFINPRGTWNDQEGREFNVGAGARHLFTDKNIIIGGNLFYDRRSTELDNTFNQVGVGFEYLSLWLDGRANYYLPEAGEQTADRYVTTEGIAEQHAEYWYEPTAQGHVISQYGYEVTDTYNLKMLQHYQVTEQAMEGFDAELGVRLPVPIIMNYADVKAFVGYYSFASHNEDEIAGVKSRLEIRPVPAIYLDASWYEDEELTGSQYSLGVRASIPFDLQRLSRGKNPFEGLWGGFKPGSMKLPLKSRLTEMVIRDLHVRTAVSAPVEVVGARRILEKTRVAHERKDTTEILAADVTFVDADNQTGVEEGTWENPYRKINTGIQQANGSRVYVREAGQPYTENVLLKEGIMLWGSGAPIYGRHGAFQGAGWPVVNGRGVGPAITLANNVTVTGFELIQPAGSPVFHNVIQGENVSGIQLVNNRIWGNGSATAGIGLKVSNRSVFDATIWGNRIQGGSGAGIDIILNAVADASVVMGQNTVTENGGDGVLLTALACGDLGLYASGHYSGNGGVGINLNGTSLQNASVELREMTVKGNQKGGLNIILQTFAGEVDLKVVDVIAAENNGPGLFVDMYGYDRVKATVQRTHSENNFAEGIQAVMVSGGRIQASFRDNRFIDNGSDGLSLNLNSGLDSQMVLKGNQVNDNEANGVSVQTLAPWDSIYDFGMADDWGLNSWSGNSDFQIRFNGLGTLFAAGNWWGTPTPHENVDFRSESGGAILVDPALSGDPTP